MKRSRDEGGIALLHLMLHYKAAVIKTIWYWLKNKDQWDRLEEGGSETIKLDNQVFCKVENLNYLGKKKLVI